MTPLLKRGRLARMSLHSVVIHDLDRGRWLVFENPVRILSAHAPGEVLPALREIEDQVNREGLYAAGFLGYEAAPAFDPALKVKPDPSGFPLLWFGLYNQPRELESLPESFFLSSRGTDEPAAPWLPSISREDYVQALAKLRQYLFEGDTYQVNYTFRLTRSSGISPWSVFLNLVAAQGAAHSAFIQADPFVIASASPELFFKLDGDRLECHPMKGTAQRGRSLEEDRLQASTLHDSAKNRAENVMIVDMVRNDLGRVAVPGSVVPGPLFEVQRYPTVWQMVSAVTAQTPASLSDIMTALFPCASITGAPKPRTMEIIASTETTPRRIYTGTIGMLAPGRRARFNVAIRTMLLDQRTGRAEYGVGGGIVWDSESGDEYEECWLKARVLTETPPAFHLLETMLWTPDEGYFLLERHLKRLADSAEYFGIPLSLEAVGAALTRPSVSQNASAIKNSLIMRIIITKSGTISIESKPVDPADLSRPARVRLATGPVNSNDRFLYHKTTFRTVYEQAKASAPDCDDVLLWNTAGELTESTIANVVVEKNGERLTPPLSSGLLPGTFRAELLARGEIREAVLRVEELPRFDRIWLVNSVRKWREAKLLFTASW